MRKSLVVLLFSIAVLGCRSVALAQTNTTRPVPASDQLCSMVASAAHANRLPIEFFARLIWQESRFRPDEVGPMTRSGDRALGIAQFMPGTAIERGLFEPFNPVEALPKSGAFLAELRDQFGNLGLAAAAYNAGPQRLRDFIAGLRDLPLETRNYVLAITGRPVEDWMKSAKEDRVKVSTSEQDTDQNEQVASCSKIMALSNRPTNSYIAEMELKVPVWCRYLQHPNLGVCGPVHEREHGMNLSTLARLKDHSHLFEHHSIDETRSVHLTGLRY